MQFQVSAKKLNTIHGWFKHMQFKPRKAIKINGMWYVTLEV